jgi:hypothetical protein
MYSTLWKIWLVQEVWGEPRDEAHLQDPHVPPAVRDIHRHRHPQVLYQIKYPEVGNVTGHYKGNFHQSLESE